MTLTSLNKVDLKNNKVDKISLIAAWTRGVRICAIAHFKTATKYRSNNRSLGLISALMGAIVTSSLFVAISKTTVGVWFWVAGILSIVSTSLTTAYSFLKWAELSEKHYRAATDYGHIRKQLEILQLKSDIADDEMEKYNEMIFKLTEVAPSIPQKIYDQSEKEVKKKEINK